MDKDKMELGKKINDSFSYEVNGKELNGKIINIEY